MLPLDWDDWLLELDDELLELDDRLLLDNEELLRLEEELLDEDELLEDEELLLGLGEEEELLLKEEMLDSDAELLLESDPIEDDDSDDKELDDESLQDDVLEEESIGLSKMLPGGWQPSKIRQRKFPKSDPLKSSIAIRDFATFHRLPFATYPRGMIIDSQSIESNYAIYCRQSDR